MLATPQGGVYAALNRIGESSVDRLNPYGSGLQSQVFLCGATRL